jgi:hypothetical protein
MTKNYIRIDSLGFGKVLLIQGSLRKWYFAEKSMGDSFDDFTQQEFDDALKKLFFCLDIPNSMRRFFYISKMEVGLTVPVNEMCRIIIRMLCGFKSSWYKQTNPEEECEKFSTNHLTLKMYNKALEIASKNIRNKQNKKHFMSVLGEKIYLRVELTVKGSKKEIENRFDIHNLKELVFWFDMFHIYFWQEVQHIEIDVTRAKEPIFDPKGKSPGEMMDFFRILGMYHYGEQEMKLMIRDLNNPKEGRRAIKRVRKKSECRKGTYNKLSELVSLHRYYVISLSHQQHK